MPELRNLFSIADPHERGRQGEQLVAKYILNYGFKIISQNLKTPHGEIDLLISKDQIFYVIEVKTRINPSPYTSNPISLAQQKRLKLAATWVWLKHRNKFASGRCLLAIVTRSSIKWKNLSLLYDRN